MHISGVCKLLPLLLFPPSEKVRPRRVALAFPTWAVHATEGGATSEDGTNGRVGGGEDTRGISIPKDEG